ncbi:MAG: transaldolase [Candidatus Spechtbacteria bacterium RIFCSPHIGHO2_02_FULL_43_15b]|uniref:Transaldolase n=1 Tax=Candidatus Spechtbacteria bacterium RIFCSPHIGHO2_01_FULL_43_30 TaxID=1802158 RepID=A0A1G2H7E0_9BACT|nr:MAG: transaldolase [Candidatus Spechtbacteria bacterium RIFCSPHIGHO2_01_FULL_43_30]OGZ58708.1 MAG: transaldolase [Candidatus Spechtbacteria bacterium RIFCSPHIGHO2_02_FULL_43_15b]
MKPQSLKTKIFLDSGDPQETREAISILGFLDGQTTNPSLISKNPAAKDALQEGKKFSLEKLYRLYREIVSEISSLMPDGSVSIEVYADSETTSREMIAQGKEMFLWIPNAHIKYPITRDGLTAASISLKENIRTNMTLCFTQEQAGAVHSATIRAKAGEVFVSPFVGRLDDAGFNGMGLIENILKMYRENKSRVQVLTASVRNLDHFLYAIRIGSDIITSPLKILKEWADTDLKLPDENFIYKPQQTLRPIPYIELQLNRDWTAFNTFHELTDAGLRRFSADWNSLLK